VFVVKKTKKKPKEKGEKEGNQKHGVLLDSPRNGARPSSQRKRTGTKVQVGSNRQKAWS